MDVEIIKHGLIYLRKAGVGCPECGKDLFRSILKESKIGKPGNGIYQMICSECSCKWREVIK